MPSKDELRADLQAQLDALDKEEDDEDYEIEIYTPAGHGARVPYRKGKTFLQQHFGIDADSLPRPDADGKTRKPSKGAGKNGDESTDEGDSGGTTPRSNLRFMRQGQGQQASS